MSFFSKKENKRLKNTSRFSNSNSEREFEEKWNKIRNNSKLQKGRLLTLPRLLLLLVAVLFLLYFLKRYEV